jgi:hypothetical protein
VRCSEVRGGEWERGWVSGSGWRFNWEVFGSALRGRGSGSCFFRGRPGTLEFQNQITMVVACRRCTWFEQSLHGEGGAGARQVLLNLLRGLRGLARVPGSAHRPAWELK